jgi:HNH endonuclease
MTWSGLPESIEQHIMPEPNSGCWIWLGGLRDTKEEYGGAAWGGRIWRVHRLVFTLLRKKVPAKLDIDHVCRNRICCNPDHLEPVTRGENVRRGQGVVPKNLAKTYCPQGHEYTLENTYVWANQRFCRTCSRVYKKNYEREQKERREVFMELWNPRTDDWNYTGP